MEFRHRVSLGLLSTGLLYGLIFGIVTSNASANGEPSSLLAEGGEMASGLSRQTVTGKVNYQPRYTRVVDEVCDGSPCKKSQMYWSLVIESNGAQYLLNEKLNVGKTRAPFFTELAGVQVRPGSVVQLEGDVVDFGSHLYSIQKILRVELVTDLGWACYNMGGGSSNIYARVWRDPLVGPQVDTKESYRMRVQEVVNRTVRPIAYILDANLAVRSNEWIFVGQSSSPKDVEVELQISDTNPRALTSPAQLKIKKKGPETLDRTSSADELSVIEMNCSRTRTELNLEAM